MEKFLKFIMILVMILPIFSYAQVCPTNTNPQQPWAWPGHSNWYFGNGNIYNFNTNTLTPLATKDSYEGVSAASDDQGNLLFYTNGRNLWRANGTLSSSALLEGNEGGGTGMKGSASQGVITIRHPFTPDDYYVLTTDDALGGTLGLNYVVVGANGNIKSGPTRLGGFRTTEGIAATLHRNGLDVWVTIQASGTTNYYTYLLTCSGFEPNPVISAGAPPSVNADKERGGLAFSPNGTKFVQGHPDYWPNSDKEITIYDFNNLTGQITNGIDISSTADADNPYDITFSTDGSLVYYTNGGTGVVWSINVSSGVKATMVASRVNTGFGGGGFSALEIGPDGQLYVGGGSAKSSTKNLGSANLGLPTMYIPPSDSLEIQPINGVTICNVPYNISTLWKCKGSDAENTPRYENAYSIELAAGAYTIDPITGVFNTAVPGNYRVRFQICDVWDTLTFNVADCQDCNVRLKDVVPEICVGNTVLLDTMLVSSNGVGVWTVDSVPSTTSVGGSIIINGTDTLFNATNLNTKTGRYKLMYTVTNNGITCEDSIYIIVNPLPKPNLGNDINICPESLGVVFDAGVYTSYSWNPNNEITQTINTNISGEYIVEVTDINGCKGKDTVNLGIYVSPIVDLGNDVSVCFGSNPVTFDATNVFVSYLWNTGEVINSVDKSITGEYIVEVTDANGCKDKDTVNLIVNPLPKPDLGPDVSICFGSNPVDFGAGVGFVNYVWNSGQNTNSISTDVAGEYIVEVTDGNGCVGKDTVNLTVNPLPKPDLGNDVDICLNGNPVIFDAGVYAMYKWTPNNETSQTINTNIAGDYIVEVTDGNGCKGKDTVVLNTITPPNPNILNDVSICPGMNQTFDVTSFDNGNGGYTYLWSNGSVTPSINVNVAGNYWVDITDSYGCVGRDEVVLTINQNLTPVIVGSPLINICEGESTTLISNYLSVDGYYFTWSPGGQNTESIDVNVSGIYDLHVDNGLGCEGDASIEVVVNPLPIVLDGLESICDGENVNVGNDLGVGYTYLWSNGETTYQINVTTSGGYERVVTTNMGCKDRSTYTVVVNPNPIVELGDDIEVCEGTNVTLTSNVVGTYQWSSGEVVNSINPTLSGDYTLTITSIDGCVGSDVVNVNFLSIPSVNLGDDLTICEGESVTISTGLNGLITNWNSGENSSSIIKKTDGQYIVTVSNGTCEDKDTVNLTVIPLPVSRLDSSLNGVVLCFDDLDSGLSLTAGSDVRYTYMWNDGQTTPTINVRDSGTYSVTISVGSCSVEDRVVIRTFCPFTLWTPNAFTPNGDMNNPTFNAYGNNIVDFKMVIFDRWGLKLFESNDINIGWDGFYMGNLVQQDVYVWKIYFSAYTQYDQLKKYTRVGTVTLVR